MRQVRPCAGLACSRLALEWLLTFRASGLWGRDSEGLHLDAPSSQRCRKEPWAASAGEASLYPPKPGLGFLTFKVTGIILTHPLNEMFGESNQMELQICDTVRGE